MSPLLQATNLFSKCAVQVCCCQQLAQDWLAPFVPSSNLLLAMDAGVAAHQVMMPEAHQIARLGALMRVKGGTSPGSLYNPAHP